MSVAKTVLDVTTGGKHIWHGEVKDAEKVVFADRRAVPAGEIEQQPNWQVQPDIQADFRELPFQDGQFDLICFDPPHRVSDGGMETISGIIETKYGALHAESWQSDLHDAFNAITQSQLADATGINPSTLRSELRRLREERNIPIANQRQGYYVIADREELKDYIGHINEEIDSKKRTIEHTLEAYETFDRDDVDIQPRPQDPSAECAECGTALADDDVMLWKSRKLCHDHWEEAALPQ